MFAFVRGTFFWTFPLSNRRPDSHWRVKDFCKPVLFSSVRAQFNPSDRPSKTSRTCENKEGGLCLKSVAPNTEIRHIIRFIGDRLPERRVEKVAPGSPAWERSALSKKAGFDFP